MRDHSRLLNSKQEIAKRLASRDARCSQRAAGRGFLRCIRAYLPGQTSVRSTRHPTKSTNPKTGAPCTSTMAASPPP